MLRRHELTHANQARPNFDAVARTPGLAPAKHILYHCSTSRAPEDFLNCSLPGSVRAEERALWQMLLLALLQLIEFHNGIKIKYGQQNCWDVRNGDMGGL